MEIKIILTLIATHFVADFLCQTDKMALNKSKSIYWLTIHVLAYTAILLIASAFLFFSLGWKTIFIYALANGALHWITDFFTSKLTTKLWQSESKHWFFVAVGADQMIHYFCLMITCNYLVQ